MTSVIDKTNSRKGDSYIFNEKIEKRLYSIPLLIKYGTITLITAGGTRANNEAANQPDKAPRP